MLPTTVPESNSMSAAPVSTMSPGPPRSGDHAAEGSRHFGHRFGGLDRHHGLIDAHVVAHLDVPLDDLSLCQALHLQIRKPRYRINRRKDS